MHDMIRIAQYFKIETPDRPGQFLRFLRVLSDADVNLVACAGFPRGRRAQLDFVLSDSGVFTGVAKKAKWKIKGPKLCFLAEGDDRPGAVADLLVPLAAAKINVTALDAVSTSGGRYGALIWVKPRDVKKAAKALGVE